MSFNTTARDASATPYASVLFVLGALLTVFAGAMLVPTFVAVAEGARSLSMAFAGSALGGAFIGGALMLSMQGAQRPALMRENIALLALAWICMPFFAAFPLWASGLYTSYENAFFLATSALTTTGASVTPNLPVMPGAFLLWRAELQWLGGYASLVMGATVLSAFGTGGSEVQRTLLPLGDMGPLYLRFVHIARGIGIVYLAVTVCGFLALAAGGIPAFDSLCLTFSAISTGGFTTRAGGISAFHAPFAEMAITLLMLYGAMNFMVHWTFWRKIHPRTYLEEPELWLLLVMCGLAFLLLGTSQVIDLGTHQGLKNLSFDIFNAVSLATTSGFWLGAAPAPSPSFIAGAVAITMIGGASVSTAGGIKLMRTWILMSQARGELRRLAFPRSLIRVRFRGLTIDPEIIVGVWALFISYAVVLGLSALALGVMGVDVMSSLIASVSALANNGPLFDLLHGNAGSFDQLPAGTRWLLCVTMIAGRLEVLGLLSVFNPAFWRR